MASAGLRGHVIDRIPGVKEGRMRGWANIAVIACLCAAPAASRADTIYSNLGGPSGGSYLITGPGSPQFEQGIRFTAEITGVLDSIDVLVRGLELDRVAAGSVRLYADSGTNKPGTLIESIPVPSIPSMALDPLPLTTVSSSLNPTLTANTTYWITMKATTSQFGWVMTDEMGKRAIRTNGGPWSIADTREATVRLNSIDVVAPVPLPSAAWGGLALMAMVGATKLRQRSARINSPTFRD
jgi:hypothetical protein